MKRLLIVLVVLGLLMSPLFAQGTKEESKSAPVEILVSAAASLTDCMNELKDVYMAGNPQVSITCNYGSSGSLQQQIEQGAPADIFFSAGVKQMDALVAKGLMDQSTVKEILENKVVLITPKNGKSLSRIEDLLNPSVEKIGVGEPKSVPVGQYTAQIFASLGLTEKLASKLVLAKDVREVLSWVGTGNVQAGLVYETDAKISNDVVVSCVAPEGSHKKVIYPVGVTKDSKQADAAKAFEDFLFSSSAKAIFAKYGFSVL